jgi:DUF4097 and DUF4098 domain-containing protein YvlB
MHAVAGTGSDVVVEITRGGADASKLEIATGEVHGRQSLRVVYPDDRIVYPKMGRNSNTTIETDDDGTWGGNTRNRHRVHISGSGSGTEAYADLKVSIPNGKKVRFFLGVGGVWISNVNGDLSVDVAGADVTTENTKGSLSLDTGSGSVSVTKADGKLNLDSGSGDVTISGARGSLLQIDSGSGEVKADDVDVDRLEIDSGSGSVKIGGLKSEKVSLDSGSGSVDLGFMGNVDQMDIDSGSGEVTLRLPANFSARFDIDAGSGGVRTDFQMSVTHYESDRLVGTVGDGKGTIHIDSGSGQVRLVKNTP